MDEFTAEPGLTDAIERAQELRRLLKAKDIVIHWPNMDISLIVDHDGHQVFVGGEPVPMRGHDR